MKRLVTWLALVVIVALAVYGLLVFFFYVGLLVQLHPEVVPLISIGAAVIVLLAGFLRWLAEEDPHQECPQMAPALDEADLEEAFRSIAIGAWMQEQEAKEFSRDAAKVARASGAGGAETSPDS